MAHQLEAHFPSVRVCVGAGGGGGGAGGCLQCMAGQQTGACLGAWPYRSNNTRLSCAFHAKRSSVTKEQIGKKILLN